MLNTILDWFKPTKNHNPTMLIEIFKDTVTGDEFVKLKIDWVKETPERLKDVFAKLFLGLKTATFQQNLYIALQDKALEVGLPNLSQEVFQEIAKIEVALPQSQSSVGNGQLMYPSEVFSPHDGEH